MRDATRNVLEVVFVAMAIGSAYATPASAITRTDADTVKAEELERQANELFSNTARVKEAAELFEKAAQLRGWSDPMHFEDLERAARLRYYIGDYRGARKSMERAADAALEIGHLFDAARNYTDAALYSIYEGRRSDAKHLVERARAIAASPLLDATQRASLSVRLQAVV